MSQNSLYKTVQFASRDRAQILLAQEDSFTKNWSQFDIDSRLQKAKGTREELFDLIDAQVREWSEKEQSEIKSALKRIDRQLFLIGAKLDLPDTMYFVKTTAKEEGGVRAYTRGNYIVFKEEIDLKQESLDHLIAHELFHVLTRHNQRFRAMMYGVIGFKIMNSVAYPDQISASRITNPDAPQTDAFIQLETEDVVAYYLMILYSDRPYTEGRFFDYVNIGFLKLKGVDKKEVDLLEGGPQIVGMKEVKNFFTQIGNNTKYIIHPEEIMAENFAMSIADKRDIPNPEIPQAIIAVLKEGHFLDK